MMGCVGNLVEYLPAEYIFNALASIYLCTHTPLILVFHEEHMYMYYTRVPVSRVLPEWMYYYILYVSIYRWTIISR